MDFPMTIQGHKKLTQELEHLTKVEREKIKEALVEARAHGDLKENAEYHAAKESQAKNEGRIQELQGKLAKAQVIDTANIKSQKVVFGATVTLYDEEKDTSITYRIVGEDEAKESPQLISYLSPIAKALIGKEEGDEIIVRAPKGDIEYQVESIEYK